MAQIELIPDGLLLSKVMSGINKLNKLNDELKKKNREEILKVVMPTKFSWRKFKFVEKTKEEIEQEVNELYFLYFYKIDYSREIFKLQKLEKLLYQAFETKSKVLLTEDDLNIIEAWSE